MIDRKQTLFDYLISAWIYLVSLILIITVVILIGAFFYGGYLLIANPEALGQWAARIARGFNAQ